MLLAIAIAARLQLLAADEDRLQQFSAALDALRQQYRIPGLSAVIVKQQQIIWEGACGYSDVAQRVPATPDTPYLVASVTKTFASVLLMHCVEQGTLNLDDPIKKYTSEIPEAGVTVRHVFTHTSESRPPGEVYKYNGARFGALTSVAEACTGLPFAVALAKTILNPSRLNDTMPGKDTGDPTPQIAAEFTANELAAYRTTLGALAKPYKIDNRGQVILSPYPQNGINAAAGVISTVRDLARYDAAIDSHTLLRAATQEQAWTNHVNSKGQVLPYALGWFVQRSRNVRLIWHYGYWDTFSALILKVPERQLTLLLLANSDGLSAPFNSLGAGDVSGSLFADLFLKMIQEPGTLRAESTALQANGVVNAASFSLTIAPGAWATAFGQNLATVSRGWRRDEVVDGNLPKALDSVMVRVGGTPAAIAYISPKQINFQVPITVSDGPTTVEVEGPLGSAHTEAMVARLAPALFQFESGGARRLLAQHADGTLAATAAQAPGAVPASPGEMIIVYGTGFGLTNPVRPSGQLIDPAPLASPFRITIGGVEVRTSYGGLVAPGLYQFNFQVPDLRNGDYAVMIETDNVVTSGEATLTVQTPPL